MARTLDRFSNPLTMLKDVNNYILNARAHIAANPHMIEEYQDDSDKSLFHIRDKSGKFFHKIKDVDQQERTYKTQFYFEYAPSSELISRPVELSGVYPTVLENLKNWVTLVHSHYSLPMYNPPKNLKQLEDEIEVEFSDSSKASDSEYFSFREQEVIHLYFELVKQKMLNEYPNDIEVGEVVADISVVQENITKLPKKTFRKGFIKIGAKVRSHSMKFAKEFGEAFKKKIFDRILSGKIIDDFQRLANYAQQNAHGFIEYLKS